MMQMPNLANAKALWSQYDSTYADYMEQDEKSQSITAQKMQDIFNTAAGMHKKMHVMLEKDSANGNNIADLTKAEKKCIKLETKIKVFFSEHPEISDRFSLDEEISPSVNEVKTEKTPPPLPKKNQQPETDAVPLNSDKEIEEFPLSAQQATVIPKIDEKEELREFKVKQPHPKIEILAQKFLAIFFKDLKTKVKGYFFHSYAQKENFKRIENSMAQLSVQKEKLEERIASLKNPQSSESHQLKNELVHLENEIESLLPDLQNMQELKTKGESTRKQFVALGGERVALRAADNVKLDATFLSAEAFQTKLQESGGQFATLKKNFADGSAATMQAIAFNQADWEKQPKHLLNTLNELGILSSVEYGIIEPVSGWSTVKFGDQILLVLDEDLNKNRDKNPPWIEFPADSTSMPYIADTEESKTEYTTEALNPKKSADAATIILSTGSEGIYEMHKRETLYFLFKGMNVMLFNFRGCGLSEGVPSKKGFVDDIEAAYEYVKLKTGQPDNKIIFNSLCMSAGPAAKIAAKHPETNIIFHQTYATYRQLVEEECKRGIHRYLQRLENLDEKSKKALTYKLKKWILTHFDFILAKGARLLAPDFNVMHNLANNRGEKALFFALDDEVVDRKHLEKNIQAIAEAGQLQHLSVFPSAGGHGKKWFKVSSQPASFLEIGKEIKLIEKKAKKEKDDLISKAKASESNLTILSEKTDELRQEADNLQQQAEKFKESNPYLSKNCAEKAQLKKEDADHTLQEYVAESNESEALRSNAAQIFKGANAQIGELLKSCPLTYVEPDLARYIYTGRNQMEHFLTKANLSNPILMSSVKKSANLLSID